MGIRVCTQLGDSRICAPLTLSPLLTHPQFVITGLVNSSELTLFDPLVSGLTFTTIVWLFGLRFRASVFWVRGGGRCAFDA